MKKIYLTAACAMLAMSAMAQETYESAQLVTQDLNGTARYIGMGGAMEALGADISTIGSNPAGVGMFRKSWVGVSGGITVQSANYDNGGKGNFGYDSGGKGRTNADLNQFGFVYSTRLKEDFSFRKIEKDCWLNVGFNYSKNRNFNQIVTAINSLDQASLNKMTFMRMARLKPDIKAWNKNMEDSRWDYACLLDELNDYSVNGLYSGWYDNDTRYKDEYVSATSYMGRKEDEGYISNFDFNISGNINNSLFLGLTVGVKDVRYRSTTIYDETLSVVPAWYLGEDYHLIDNRRITGTGYDVKFGFIVLPIENSSFRIGAYVHSPTWYTLNCHGSMSNKTNLPYEEYLGNNKPAYELILPDAEVTGQQTNVVLLESKATGDYDYKYRIITPWKFGVSLGHTIGNTVALGATYEYADYSTIKNRVNDGYYTDSYYYEHWDGYYEYNDYHDTFARDDQMDRHTGNSLKGVHTLKFGAEVKPVPEVAIRFGYNWVSPMYKSDASKDFTINPNQYTGSRGSYATTYDYINWKDTHRVTFGLGFKLSPKVNLDLSYQFSTQKGDYHPFQNIENLNTYTYTPTGHAIQDETPSSIYGTSTKINNNRHQVNCTLGIRI